jgi:F-type H+-transporting ATPase subunit delta
MASNHEPNPIADAYARPLLELATEQDQTKPVGEELAQLADLIRQNKTFGLYLADPAIGHDEREGVLKRVFGGRISPLVQNFLGVLNRRDKLRYVGDIAKAYHELLEAQLGNIEVDVTSAQKLSAEDLEAVRQKIGAALGKNAVVHQFVDESILGGLVVRVEDRLIDASVRYQLQAMKEQLLAAAPR